MGLGPFPAVSLAAAREQAAECRRMVCSDHIDTIAARNAQREKARRGAAKMMTFRLCAEAYFATHQAGWRIPKHRAQWPSTQPRLADAAGADPLQSRDFPPGNGSSQSPRCRERRPAGTMRCTVSNGPIPLKAYVLPALGTVPSGDIDLGLFMRTVEPIWMTKPETAGRVARPDRGGPGPGTLTYGMLFALAP
jgi:hypothetical protein